MKGILFTALFQIIVSSSFSTVFEVGSGKMFDSPAKVINLVKDGDTVLIDDGLYQEEGTWTKNNLLIRGVSKFVHMQAPAVISNEKAIWVIAGNDNRIENIEFSGAKVPDKNGAGIRFEGTNLTVSHCYFHNCEDGILTGKNTSSTITIEYTEFAYCGYGDGYSHNLYIGNNGKLIFRFNYSHHAKSGHCLKSRANENYIYYNRIMDENDGNSSYLINLPNGGKSYIFANSLMQGPLAENRVMIDYGSEGYSNPENNLYVFNNTLINKRNPGNYIRTASGLKLVQIINNIFAGFSAVASDAIPSFADTSNNFRSENISSLFLLDEPNFDYHLTANSPVIDKGLSLGNEAMLFSEYKHKCDSAYIEFDNITDIGAYQYAKQASIYNEANNLIKVTATNNLLTVKNLEDTYSECVLDIYNLTGDKEISFKVDIHEEKIAADITVLPKGCYIFRIKCYNKQYTGKLIKY